MLNAMQQELIQRKNELAGERVDSIYWGGGTPSTLSATEINALYETMQAHYNLGDDLEITLEANPDDLTPAYLSDLRNYTPVNRLSIGLQSFVEEDLRLMNRAHNAAEARACLEESLRHDFTNLSIDLIYGSPTLSNAAWVENLKTIFEYKIPHISCYALTVEDKTALEYNIRKGKTQPIDEEKTAQQFEILLEQMAANGYEQYEISNFCRPPHYARHNTSYWQGKKYIGIGAAAHSFDGASRRWNMANNALYIKNLENNLPYWETEILTPENIFNEYVMTALRTKWGMDKQKLATFAPAMQSHFERVSRRYLQRELLAETPTGYRLTDAGKLLADSIMGDLFV